MKKLMSGLRNTEVATLAAALLGLFSKTQLDDESLTDLFGRLKTLYESTTEAINRTMDSSTLGEYKITRNELIRALASMLEGYIKHPEDEKKEAAKRLLTIFNKYGRSIIKNKKAVETSYIDSLILDFKDETAVADLALLPDVSTCVQALEATQTAYMAAWAAYTQTLVEQMEKENASALKTQLRSVINDIAAYLSVLSQTKNDIYGEFAKEVETEIVRANASWLRSKKATKTTSEESNATSA